MALNSGHFTQIPCLFMAAISVFVMIGEFRVEGVVVPSTDCYVIDNSSHLVDFVSFSCLFAVLFAFGSSRGRKRFGSAKEPKTKWASLLPKNELQEADLVVRFCKDAETRSQGGSVDFGWFDKLNHFVPSPGRVDYIQVSPEEGLDIKLSGIGMTGRSPTTLSPSTLILDWRCNVPSKTPYEVEITIPAVGYEPIQFTLSKMCEHRQGGDGDAIRGWAVFGILSCLCLVSSTLLCIGGFIYKTRVERQRGLDALPGITVLSACLETVSGGSAGYTRPEDFNTTFASQTSWEQQQQHPGYNQRHWKPNELRTYGSM